MKNTWLELNKRTIDKLKYKLVEYDYAGSYGGNIPLLKINSILDGALAEIGKLQKENNKLGDLAKKLTAEIELQKKEKEKNVE